MLLIGLADTDEAEAPVEPMRVGVVLLNAELEDVERSLGVALTGTSRFVAPAPEGT